MSFKNNRGWTTAELFREPMHSNGGMTNMFTRSEDFYVELEKKCKRRAAREVNELKDGDKQREETKTFNEDDIQRVPRYLKEENISRIEAYLSEHYMETVYQKLWEKAQNAVYGADSMN